VEILLSAGHECGMLLSGWSLEAANFLACFVGEITVDSQLKAIGHEVQRSRIRKIMREIVPRSKENLEEF
jgi:hypothetical protein